jgi:hypothetical protein
MSNLFSARASSRSSGASRRPAAVFTVISQADAAETMTSELASAMAPAAGSGSAASSPSHQSRM